MKYSATLEKFLNANRGKLIWVLLKESSETILGELVEFEESVIVLNIVERQNDTVEVTDVLLLFDLDSVFGFTAGEESFAVFKKAVEETRRASIARRRHMDERETA
jgi:hypothetical protein